MTVDVTIPPARAALDSRHIRAVMERVAYGRPPPPLRVGGRPGRDFNPGFLAAQFRLGSTQVYDVRSIEDMRISAGSRAPTPAEDAAFDELFAGLPSDDEG